MGKIPTLRSCLFPKKRDRIGKVGPIILFTPLLVSLFIWAWLMRKTVVFNFIKMPDFLWWKCKLELWGWWESGWKHRCNPLQKWAAERLSLHMVFNQSSIIIKQRIFLPFIWGLFHCIQSYRERICSPPHVAPQQEDATVIWNCSL